jgi:hypothetical protein
VAFGISLRDPPYPSRHRQTSRDEIVGAGCVRFHPEIRGMPGGGSAVTIAVTDWCCHGAVKPPSPDRVQSNLLMSALPPKADMCRATSDVRFGL